jgi:hypothetical protein
LAIAIELSNLHQFVVVIVNSARAQSASADRLHKNAAMVESKTLVITKGCASRSQKSCDCEKKQ